MNPLKLSQGGKLETKSCVKINQKNVGVAYTPGVAQVVKEVMKNKENAYKYTWKHRSVAIVSDGTAILGLGNQGALAALPVMEAKGILFKELGGIDAVPIVLDTQDPKKIIEIVKNIAPTFGGINLEDIAAPNCFTVLEELKKTLDIPVFHDDQYGTAIVALAGLINATKVAGKDFKRSRVVISGAGAAGIATTKLLQKYGAKEIILFDSTGPIYQSRKKLNFAKKEIAQKTNKEKFKESIQEALKGADIFIGLSRGKLLKTKDISQMNKDAIVFALANPEPEIMPDQAKKGGARIVATGRSDFPNQINNALVFPGIFQGALKTRTVNINMEIKIKAALALAETVKKPTANRLLPDVMDKKAVKAIAGVF